MTETKVHETVASLDREKAIISEVKEWLEEWNLYNSVNIHWGDHRDDIDGRQVSFKVPSFTGINIPIAQSELDDMGWHIEEFEATNRFVLEPN